MRGGYEDSTLEALAKIGRKWKVNEYVIEGNFGDGMYLELFKPVAARIHPAAVTEVKSKGQKELRICDVLEPIMGSHKLAVDEQVIYDDYNSAKSKDGTHSTVYSGFYQMTRITRDKGALAHDDRLDALAIGVQYFVESMDVDSQKGNDQMLEDFLEEHLEHSYSSTQQSVFEIQDGGIVITSNDHDNDSFGSSFIDKW